MDECNYYSDQKYCPECDCYVLYLKSLERGYCVDCGCEVRLFSVEDMAAFRASMEKKKGRPPGGSRKGLGA